MIRSVRDFTCRIYEYDGKNLFKDAEGFESNILLFLADLGICYEILYRTYKCPKNRGYDYYNVKKLKIFIKRLNEYNNKNNINYERIKLSGNKEVLINRINDYLIFFSELFPTYDENSPFYHLEGRLNWTTGTVDGKE